ncbi:MAG: hypothetical protein ACRCYV_02490 [Aeromonas sp.]
MDTLSGDELSGMVEHWLSTPLNSYLGSDYGQEVRSLLQRPQRDEGADQLVRKLRADLPLIGALPPEAVAVYGTPSGIDQLKLMLTVLGREFDLPAGKG